MDSSEVVRIVGRYLVQRISPTGPFTILGPQHQANRLL